MTDPVFSFDRLFPAVGSRGFFQDYWQRRSLSENLEKSTLSRILAEVGDLEIVSIAKIARKGVQAWISGPHIAHSVFEADAVTVGDFHRVGASLYFVDVPVPTITDAIADALGAPRWRIRASLFLSPRSSGASPHFDSNENFTVQLTGAKRWYVESGPLAVMPPVGHFLGDRPAVSVEKLIDPQPANTEIRFDMKPGTFLYVPRGTVHRTRADAESWSLNICYSGTTWLELLQDGLRRRLLDSPRWRSTVTGLSKDCEPGAAGANIFPELIEELRQIIADPREVEDMGRFFLEQANGKP